MLNVKIDELTALDMLCERVRFWRSGEQAELFDKMYENYVYNGFFEDGEFDVDLIVDNDVVNYCSIIGDDEKDFKKLLKLYKDGEYDVSSGNLNNGSTRYFEEYKVSFIEAVSDDERMILIRY